MQSCFVWKLQDFSAFEIRNIKLDCLYDHIKVIVLRLHIYWFEKIDFTMHEFVLNAI